jgi:drug/metabolite transporter (DMT)-like permease
VLGWLIIGATLPRLPAAMTSLLLTVQPIGTLALAALIFGEDPSGLQLGGVLLVVVGLLVATSARQRRRTAGLSAGPSPARRSPPVPVQPAQEP